MTRELCIHKFNSLIDNYEICEKIENSIYNYAVEQSDNKGIEKNINNKYFKRIYVNKIIALYNNLDEASYIKNVSFLKRLINKDLAGLEKLLIK